MVNIHIHIQITKQNEFTMKKIGIIVNIEYTHTHTPHTKQLPSKQYWTILNLKVNMKVNLKVNLKAN